MGGSSSDSGDSSQRGLKKDIGAPEACVPPDIAVSKSSICTEAELEQGLERRVLTKVDLRLIPTLSLMYLLAFLDRTNIANAAVYGLADDLHIAPASNDYNTALTLFFIPYIIFEIPSNLVLKRLRPHVWLSLCMLAFGLITVCQGLVTNKAGLYAVRFFLGLAETGMFPGSFYLIGMWYRRQEAQKRCTFFFASTSLAGAFGGLIAAGINRLNGALGYAAWRWIFLIEGSVTMFFALVLFFWIPDFPEQASFLTPAERALVVRRLQADQGVASEADQGITWRDALACVRERTVILGGFMYLGLIVPAYSYAYFAPGIVQSLGFTAVQAQLRSVSPWAAAWVWSLLLAWASDRYRHRSGFALGSLLIGIVGFAVLLGPTVPLPARLAALHLVTCGVYGAMPIALCWFNLNLAGHRRRAVGTAWQIGFGNLGGIVGTYAFLPRDRPAYVLGYALCIGFATLALVAGFAYLLCIVAANRRAQRATPALLLREPSLEAPADDTRSACDPPPAYRYMY